MKIIELTSTDPERQKVFVNADHIIAFQTYEGRTWLKLSDGGTTMKVRETAKDIIVKLGVTVR